MDTILHDEFSPILLLKDGYLEAMIPLGLFGSICPINNYMVNRIYFSDQVLRSENTGWTQNILVT